MVARTEDEQTLATARAQRADLHTVLIALEQALAAPIPGRPIEWATQVHDALVDVAATFERHIAVTEGPGGLFDHVVRASPRLANAIEKLRDEHEQIRRVAADTLAEIRTLARGTGVGVEDQRERLLGMLTALSRHRQRGADLVYEAYAVDIGGGD